MKSQYPCQVQPKTPVWMTASTTSTRPVSPSSFFHTSMLKWKPSRRKRRYVAYSGLMIILCLVLLILPKYQRISQSGQTGVSLSINPRSPHPLIDKHVPLWASLHGLIRNNNPQCKKKPDLVVPQNIDIAFDSSHNHPRPDILWVDDADIARLKSVHANFVSDVRSHALKLAYEPGTRGIVTVASEPLLTTLTISLRMLRKTSSNLPVEVYLRSPSSHSESFCSTVFPALNAECFYLSDIFAAAGTVASPTMHQSKVLSLLFSSFEDVLFLDPCSFPTTIPETLFHSLPFTDAGLVLWPDFWYSSESPYYFDIAKITDIPSLSLRAATESGQLLYSKSKHAESLMLATYYNFYGPEYYYLLHSQGGPGAGEKETFGLAALALKEPIHFVSHALHSLGRHNHKSDWIGTGMIQFDPVADYFSQSHNRVPVVQPEDIAHPPMDQRHSKTDVKPMFVHPDYPKFDPRTIFRQNGNDVNTAMKDENGTASRSWMPQQESVALFGFDLEARFWEEIQNAVCGSLLGLWVDGGRPDRRAVDFVKRRDTELCEKVRGYNMDVFHTAQA